MFEADRNVSVKRLYVVDRAAGDKITYMPLYEYLCQECDSPFDRLSSISEADEAICPSCGGSHTRRLLSVIGGLATQSPGQTSGCGCGGACSCN